MSIPSSPTTCPGHLSDRELLVEVARAATEERRATAHLLALLIELDARRLYLGEGFSSLFTYCTQALHLSEHASYNRIEAARAARRFPIILQHIGDGALTLTAVRLLAPHLTPDNHREVLASARHKNKREVELLVASLHPQPDVPVVVRKLPTRAATATPANLAPDMQHLTAIADRVEPDTVVPPGVITTPPAVTPTRHLNTAALKPIAPERYKIQFTAGRETYEMLRRAQDLLRHVVPDGDPAVIIDRALTLLVKELERTKVGSSERPRAGRAVSPGARHVPAAVRRAIWQRDGGRCAFVGTQGRCSETGFLEYHHVVPFAEGGAATSENLELRCRSHNQYESQRWLAPDCCCNRASWRRAACGDACSRRSSGIQPGGAGPVRPLLDWRTGALSSSKRAGPPPVHEARRQVRFLVLKRLLVS